jgi:hypothetical protein
LFFGDFQAEQTIFWLTCGFEVGATVHRPNWQKTMAQPVLPFHLTVRRYRLLWFIPRLLGERSMQGSFDYKVEGNGDTLALSIDLDSVSAKALVRLDRYINWSDILKLTENDPEAADAAERLHTVLQHLGR